MAMHCPGKGGNHFPWPQPLSFDPFAQSFDGSLLNLLPWTIASKTVGWHRVSHRPIRKQSTLNKRMFFLITYV